MALRLGELSAIIGVDDSEFYRKLDAAERRFDAFAAHIAAASEAAGLAAGAAGGNAGEGFTRSAEGRLRDAKGRFVAAGTQAGESLGDGVTKSTETRLRDARGRFVKAGQDLGDGIGGGAQQGFASKFLTSINQALGPALSGLKGAGENLAGVLNPSQWLMLAGGVLAAASALDVLPSAISAVAGGLAALPGLATGAGVAFGALLLGLHGVGNAISAVFAPATKTAGSSVNNLSAAERQLAAAQRESKRAQEDLNKAREEAAEDIEDLERNLRHAQLDEKQAAINLADARKALIEAERGGNQTEIVKAKVAYEQAGLAVDDAKDKTEDLTKEQQHAVAVGVEGSDKVQAALDRQASAADALASAHEAVAKATVSAGGGVNKLDEALSQLSPNAKSFVLTLMGLKGQLHDLQMMVQDRLFAGLDEELKSLALVWGPELRKTLGLMADDWNYLLRQFGRSVSRPEVLKAFDDITMVVDSLMRQFGNTNLDPLIKAFAELADASTPVIKALGEGLMKWLLDFSTWVDVHAHDGSLNRFFQDAATNVRTLFDIGELVVQIFVQFYDIMTGDNPKNATQGLDDIKNALQNVLNYMKSPEGRQTIKDFIQSIEDLASALWSAVTAIGWIITKVDQLNDKINSFTNSGGGGKLKTLLQLSGFPGYVASHFIPSGGNPSGGGGASADFFDAGGWIPGPAGAPRPIVAHGREYMLSTDMLAGRQPVDMRVLSALANQMGGGTAAYLPGSPAAGSSTPAASRFSASSVGVLRHEITIRGTGLLAGLRETVAINGGSVQAVVG